MIEILILIIIAFVQSSLLSFDLLLIFLTLKSYINYQKKDYLYAFGAGLLVSILTSTVLGWHSLYYIIALKIINLIRSQFIKPHFLWSIPTVLFVVSFQNFLENIFFTKSFDIKLIMAQAVIVLPLYLLILIWQDRISFSKEAKLSLKR